MCFTASTITNPVRRQAMVVRSSSLRTAQGISLPPRLKSEIKRELQQAGTGAIEMIRDS